MVTTKTNYKILHHRNTTKLHIKCQKKFISVKNVLWKICKDNSYRLNQRLSQENYHFLFYVYYIYIATSLSISCIQILLFRHLINIYILVSCISVLFICWNTLYLCKTMASLGKGYTTKKYQIFTCFKIVYSVMLIEVCLWYRQIIYKSRVKTVFYCTGYVLFILL